MRMSPLAKGDAYRLWRLYTPRKGQPHCSITGWRTHISISMRPISSKRGQGYLARQRQGPGEPYPYRGTLATHTEYHRLDRGDQVPCTTMNVLSTDHQNSAIGQH